MFSRASGSGALEQTLFATDILVYNYNYFLFV